ncbi:MAG TPA: DUF4870 domain-containing protein [Candidatus Borkfalkia stercoripullorum]|nr:DUF4870 domain-containing protein [Candidatus Borkfalkia stercoripullorum]
MDENNRSADEVEKRDASSVPENGTPSSEGGGKGGGAPQGNDPNGDVQKKVVCALTYLFGILFFLPLIVYPDDDFARFHANQGLIVLLVSVIGGAVLGILTMLPVVGLVFTILSSLFGVVMLVACIFGILNVVREEKRELPVIGKFTIIK